jgi:hypothetical protein
MGTPSELNQYILMYYHGKYGTFVPHVNVFMLSYPAEYFDPISTIIEIVLGPV